MPVVSLVTQKRTCPLCTSLSLEESNPQGNTDISPLPPGHPMLLPFPVTKSTSAAVSGDHLTSVSKVSDNSGSKCLQLKRFINLAVSSALESTSPEHMEMNRACCLFSFHAVSLLASKLSYFWWNSNKHCLLVHWPQEMLHSVACCSPEWKSSQLSHLHH